MITLGEIMRGIIAKQRTDRPLADRLSVWLDSLRRDYADGILDVDIRVATAWGRLSAERSRGDADGLIAATAIVHDLTVVTRNVRHFHGLEVSVVDPWNVAPQAGSESHQ